MIIYSVDGLERPTSYKQIAIKNVTLNNKNKKKIKVYDEQITENSILKEENIINTIDNNVESKLPAKSPIKVNLHKIQQGRQAKLN